MTTQKYAFCLSLVLGFGLVQSAGADVVINFDDDVIGSTPLVNPTPGSTVTQPWAIGGYGAPGTIIVDNVPGMSKAAVITTAPGDPTLGNMWLDIAPNLTAQEIRFSFDINVLQAPESATTQPKILDGSGTAGILLGMNAFQSGLPSFRFAAAPTSDGGGVFAFRSIDNAELNSFFNYTEGQTYNVAIEANYNTGTLDAFVDGVLLLDNYQFLATGVANAWTSEFFFHLNGEAGYTNSVAIDNIQAAAVPEPSSLLLCGALAGAGYFARRKKAVAAAATAAKAL